MKDWSNNPKFPPRQRRLDDYNYNAWWNNLETIRFGTGDVKELPADWSEFYDVSIGSMCNLECPFCLTPESLITTSTGKKEIKDITVDDFVYAFDENTGNVEIKSVIEIYSRDYDADLIELETENGIIHITPNHKVYTQNRGWIEAGNLQLNDILLEI